MSRTMSRDEKIRKTMLVVEIFGFGILDALNPEDRWDVLLALDGAYRWKDVEPQDEPDEPPPIKMN
jgi:hypothetical protein